MYLRAQIISLLTSVTLAHGAPAGSGVEFIWDSSKGPLPASACQVVSSKDINFRIVEHTAKNGPAFEHVYTKTGEHYSYVLDNALVMTKDTVEGDANPLIQIVGVSPNSSLDTSKGFLSRLDQGYMKQASLKNADGYTIEVTNAPSDAKMPGAFWRLAKTDGQYVAFRCSSDASKDYVAFDIYASESAATPVARIGVSTADTSIFKNIRVKKTATAAASEPGFFSKMISAIVPLPQPRPEIPTAPATPVTAANAEAPAAPSTSVSFKVVSPTPTPAPISTSLSTSTDPVIKTAEELFGSDKIPKITDGDLFYKKAFYGPDASKSQLCRQEWKSMRNEKVSKEPFKLDVDAVLEEAHKAGFEVTAEHLKKTVAVYLANQSDIPNQHFISFIDFNKRSDRNRMFILDLKTGKFSAYPVAAGMGSDPLSTGYATLFSNIGKTHTSSLGCYMAYGDYKKSVHGYAILLHGFEGENSHACERDIEFHKEVYVGQVPGRSWGCFAVKPNQQNVIYSKVRKGLICAYYNEDLSSSNRAKDHVKVAELNNLKIKTYSEGGHRHARRHKKVETAVSTYRSEVIP